MRMGCEVHRVSSPPTTAQPATAWPACHPLLLSSAAFGTCGPGGTVATPHRRQSVPIAAPAIPILLAHQRQGPGRVQQRDQRPMSIPLRQRRRVGHARQEDKGLAVRANHGLRQSRRDHGRAGRPRDEHQDRPARRQHCSAEECPAAECEEQRLARNAPPRSCRSAGPRTG